MEPAIFISATTARFNAEAWKRKEISVSDAWVLPFMKRGEMQGYKVMYQNGTDVVETLTESQLESMI